MATLALAAMVLGTAASDGPAMDKGALKAGKKAMVMVFFGTSVPEAQKCIDAYFSEAARVAGPDVKVVRAYTSNIIRRKLLKEENRRIPTPLEALAELQDSGFDKVFVQPAHVIPGEEYDDLKAVVDALASIGGKYGFKELRMGRALLMNEQDCEMVARAMHEHYGPLLGKDEAMVFMGHGTGHLANAMYSQMQTCLSRFSPRFFMGTVEGTPTLGDVLLRLEPEGYRKVALAPFMVVAGDHARNDMAGLESDSWKSVMEARGLKVRTFLDGFGNLPSVVKFFGDRVAEDLKGF